MSKVIINGDISLFIATTFIGQAPISIDEAAIRQFAANNSEITGLSFNGWTMNEIISGPPSQFKPMYVGFGLRSNNF